jgi:MFS family permease
MISALLLNLVGFANYAAVLPALRTATGFSETQAGFAGGVFFLAYAVGSPIFAGLTDTRDARKLFLLGGCMSIAGGLVFPLANDSFLALMASRVLTGLGMAGTYMPGLRLLIDNLPLERQQRAAGDYVSALTLGLSGSFALSGMLEWLFGWQAAFLGAAACAALALLVVFTTMPRSVPVHRTGSLFSRLLRVAKMPNVGLTLLAVGGNSWEGMGFRTWWVALLQFSVTAPGNESYGWINFALATALVGPLAMPLSAWVARRAEAGQRYVVIAIAAGCSVLVGGGLGCVLGAPLPVVFILSALYVCTIFSDAGALTPAAIVCVPPDDRGAVLALQAAASNGAAFVSVIVCGVVLHAAGGVGSETAWRYAIIVLITGSAITTFAMLALNRRKQERRLSV